MIRNIKVIANSSNSQPVQYPSYMKPSILYSLTPLTPWHRPHTSFSEALRQIWHPQAIFYRTSREKFFKNFLSDTHAYKLSIKTTSQCPRLYLYNLQKFQSDWLVSGPVHTSGSLCKPVFRHTVSIAWNRLYLLCHRQIWSPPLGSL